MDTGPKYWFLVSLISKIGISISPEEATSVDYVWQAIYE